MADALTGLALYSAFSEQVYRRAYINYQADQPLTLEGDGSALGTAKSVAGQTLADPRSTRDFDTDPQTAGRFQIDNNYIYNTATGFVAMVTLGTDGRYNVTFRGTDMGDSSQ